jgi:hypothetical protein
MVRVLPRSMVRYAAFLLAGACSQHAGGTVLDAGMDAIIGVQADALASDGGALEAGAGCRLRPEAADASLPHIGPAQVALSGPAAFAAAYGSGGLARSESGAVQAFLAVIELTDDVLPLRCARQCPTGDGHSLTLTVADRMGQPIGAGEYPRDGFLAIAAYYERAAGSRLLPKHTEIRRLTLAEIGQNRARGSFEVLLGDPPGELLAGTFDVPFDPCWTPSAIGPGM